MTTCIQRNTRDYERITEGKKQLNAANLTDIELDRHMADRASRAARKILKEINKRDLGEATLHQLGVTFGILLDRSRLLKNQSTQNIAVSGRIEALNRISILGGRLGQALQGRDGSSLMLTPGEQAANNGSYCESGGDTPVIDAQAQVLDTDALALQRVAALAPAPAKKRRGRPPKVRATP